MERIVSIEYAPNGDPIIEYETIDEWTPRQESDFKPLVVFQRFGSAPHRAGGRSGGSGGAD